MFCRRIYLLPKEKGGFSSSDLSPFGPDRLSTSQTTRVGGGPADQLVPRVHEQWRPVGALPVEVVDVRSLFFSLPLSSPSTQPGRIGRRGLRWEYGGECVVTGLTRPRESRRSLRPFTPLPTTPSYPSRPKLIRRVQGRVGGTKGW